jgi:glucose/mannose-6-phosphate isomerase
MKTILDTAKTYDQYDPQQVRSSLVNLSQQFESAWHDAQFINLGFDTASIHQIVIVGMGGSNLAAHIVQSISPLLLKIPYEIVANYRLPQYVGRDTLVILVSYSGNTEEILSCAEDAKQRQSKTIVITTGGKIKIFALDEHWPLLLLDEKLNLSRIPRFGIGLMIGSLLGIFVRLNPDSFRFVDPKEIVRVLDRGLENLSVAKSLDNNPAKSLAEKNKGQSLILISANHLTGVAKVATNFFNETSKTFSASFNIPDLNHHLLEGLSFPTTLRDNTRFLLLDSALYPEVIQKRFRLTKDMLLRQKYQLTVIKPESTEIISQVFESLVFLVMFSYYLSIVNKQDPGTNPWVDLFKKQLI